MVFVIFFLQFHSIFNKKCQILLLKPTLKIPIKQQNFCLDLTFKEPKIPYLPNSQCTYQMCIFAQKSNVLLDQRDNFRKPYLMFSYQLKYPTLDIQPPGSTQATSELPPLWIRILSQQQQCHIKRAIRHIAPGSNTLHIYMYSPSTHIALSIGAIMRRTIHHSKVTSTLHLQNVINNYLSFVSD